MIDSIDGFVEALGPIIKTAYSPAGRQVSRIETEGMYCPTCQDERRMIVSILAELALAQKLWIRKKTNKLAVGMLVQGSAPDIEPIDLKDVPPGLFLLQCVQCKKNITALLYVQEELVKLSFFPVQGGGISTENTHSNVKGFLDEAYKCQCMGAYIAAGVMYRAALEQILNERGWKKGDLLGAKLDALEKAKEENKEPDWARNIDVEILKHLKDIGNQVHLKSGDFSTLQALDELAMKSIEIIFHELLDEIYEAPKRRENRSKQLADVKAKLKFKQP